MSLYQKALYSLLLSLQMLHTNGNAQRNYLGIAYNYHVLTTQEYFPYRFSTIGVNYRHFLNDRRFMITHTIGLNASKSKGTTSTDIHQLNYLSYNINRNGRVNMHLGPLLTFGMSQQRFNQDILRENRRFVGVGIAAGIGLKLTRSIWLYLDHIASQEYNAYRFSSTLSIPPARFANNSFNLYSSLSISLFSF